MSYDWEDNSNVLRWLAVTLSEAESAGEKVHIISHIPPGNNDCLGAWGRNYARIIERQVIMSTKDFFSTRCPFFCALVLFRASVKVRIESANRVPNYKINIAFIKWIFKAKNVLKVDF